MQLLRPFGSLTVIPSTARDLLTCHTPCPLLPFIVIPSKAAGLAKGVGCEEPFMQQVPRGARDDGTRPVGEERYRRHLIELRSMVDTRATAIPFAVAEC